MQITIEIPDDIAESLAERVNDLPRHVLEALAIEGYRNEYLSHSEVGQVLNLSRWEVEALLKKADAYLHYTLEDFEQDCKTSEKSDKASQPA